MGKLAAAPAKTADATPAAEAETTTKKKRGKRKRDDAAGDGPAGSDAAEEEARVYNDALWKLRDDIRKNLAMSEMRAVLEFVFTSEPPHPPPPFRAGQMTCSQRAESRTLPSECPTSSSTASSRNVPSAATTSSFRRVASNVSATRPNGQNASSQPQAWTAPSQSCRPLKTLSLTSLSFGSTKFGSNYGASHSIFRFQTSSFSAKCLQPQRLWKQRPQKRWLLMHQLRSQRWLVMSF